MGGPIDLSVPRSVGPVPRRVPDPVGGEEPPDLRRALVGRLQRRHGVEGLDVAGVLPVAGVDTAVEALPAALGVGRGDLVVHPRLAPPAHARGAAAVGARRLAADSLTALGPERPRLVWVATPGDPTGRVLPVRHLRKVVDWCRERDVLLVADESQLDHVWEGEAPSVLHPSVSGDRHHGLLALHAPASASDPGGAGGAFVVGDPAVVERLRHAGDRLRPAWDDRAVAAVLADDDHAAALHRHLSTVRRRLRSALVGAGFTVEEAAGSLHLWATRGEDCHETVAALAERGVSVAPGDAFGPAGGRHVRVAVTVTEEEAAEVERRLSGLGVSGRP
ncbi:aminotransferase class I/II-fold pyridoxal phosphate-dependent enzyme [Nocardioides sp. TF02-7]|uniref:aminotransferase class I/II-fold pyridoxal phosphate-dependent enzyme n=1 Tax=Nocardioides sp. TF02-7 TaxID=2917724 RepID=UPI001F068AC4|nr:aminotransferase class I/II-fold pyridoxal phosphate-dependent enzyme [Nocardioides sp. TF02-7]UMG91757.1 aminotransferase class I/II-fold pyridoxal phosphate-dependent enzyme [Nocardioides sp. TF02-7]